MEDVEKRLERLERSLRRVKLAAVVLVVAAGALALLGQAGPQKTVIAERFVMQDPQGRQRLIIGMVPEGPSLGIYDERGVARLFAAIAKDRPFVSLNDGNNKARAELAIDSGQNAVLKLRDARENERLAAGVDEKGVAQVKFSDEKRVRMSLGLLPVEIGRAHV